MLLTVVANPSIVLNSDETGGMSGGVTRHRSILERVLRWPRFARDCMNDATVLGYAGG